MKRIALVLLGTVLLSVNTSAWALFGDDEARKAILELRDQLKSQQEVQMSLYDRLEKLTKEVQTLRGKVEDLTNSVGKEKQNAETIYDDLSNRLNEMDPKAKAAPLLIGRFPQSRNLTAACPSFKRATPTKRLNASQA